MGDNKTLAMARKELEEMYVGVPDDSVNLSFQELAQIIHSNKLSPSSTLQSISESRPGPGPSSEISPAALAKLPSLDFTKALQHASLNHHAIDDSAPRHHRQLDHPTPHHHHHHHQLDHPTPHHHHHHHQLDHPTPHHHHQQHQQLHHQGAGFRPSPLMDQRSFMFDDMSHVSNMNAVAYGGGGGRSRRPGIPHSNVCTVCSTYIYIFRHRCLVCGRVYCRQCVAIGMGEMTEGRKCKDCLGKRFSQRYIKKAGNVGCCLGYPSTVKQQELKWAEKGPRTATYSRQSMVAPASRSPRPPPIPTTHHSNPPSFIASSPYPNNNRHHFAPF